MSTIQTYTSGYVDTGLRTIVMDNLQPGNELLLSVKRPVDAAPPVDVSIYDSQTNNFHRCGETEREGQWMVQKYIARNLSLGRDHICVSLTGRTRVILTVEERTPDSGVVEHG